MGGGGGGTGVMWMGGIMCGRSVGGCGVGGSFSRPWPFWSKRGSINLLRGPHRGNGFCVTVVTVHN